MQNPLNLTQTSTSRAPDPLILNHDNVSLSDDLIVESELSHDKNHPKGLLLEKQELSPHVTGYSLYSLNNVTADAPPPPSHTNIPGHKKGVSCLLNSTFASGEDYGKRDFLNSTLTRYFPDISWSDKPWSFISAYQGLAEKVFNIDSSEYSPYRRYEFETCYSKKGAKGRIHTEVGNQDKRYRERFHCGEPGCLLCGKLSRQRLALEWVEHYKQIIAKNPGFPGFLTMDFTLPEKYEGVPLYDEEVEKSILNGIQGIVRRVFGLKSRSNIEMNFCVHPVGDSDLFRDRWHVHVIIMPAEIRKDKKTGEKSFDWVYPVQVAHNHTQKDWKLDFVWLKDEYNKVLSDSLRVDSPEAIHPQVEFISYDKNARKWKGKLKGRKFEDVFWAKVTHRIKYDMRSFAKDLENAVVRTDKENNQFIVKVKGPKKDDVVYWLLVDGLTLVQRYKWIKKHNKIRARGWGQCKKRYIDVLGLVENDPGEEPDCIVSDANIEVIRRKAFDLKTGKVVWEREEIYHFKCPISNEEMSVNAQNMPRWKWDLQLE